MAHQGVQGVQGVQGEDGEQGIQGIQGIQGTNGEKSRLWQILFAVLSVTVVLIGTVWAITWGSTASRVCNLETRQTVIIEKQATQEANYTNIKESLIRIERKINEKK
jgi:Tfp pilus assembly protein PilO